LYKIKAILSAPHCTLLRFFIIDRGLLVMNVGFPHGTVPEPFLYILYTVDMPVPSPSAPSAKVLLATYAEVKAMLPSHKSLQTATNAVQECLNDIKIWAAKWDTAINC